MKNVLLIIFVSTLVLAGFTQPTHTYVSTNPEQNKPAEDSVLICDSPGGYAYHKKYCSGLQKCTHDVLKLPLSEAIKKGKSKPCGFCY